MPPTHPSSPSISQRHVQSSRPYRTMPRAWQRGSLRTNGRLACPMVWAIINVVAIRPKCRDLSSLSKPGMIYPAVRPWLLEMAALRPHPRTRSSGQRTPFSLFFSLSSDPGPWGDAKWASSDSTRKRAQAHDMFLIHQSTTLKLGTPTGSLTGFGNIADPMSATKEGDEGADWRSRRSSTSAGCQACIPLPWPHA